MNLIILGPPGSGKGTQSDFLVEQYHFVHLSTGDLLRNEMAEQTEIGLSAKSYIDQGKYVPDDVMNGIVANIINKLQDNFILDGYPRTLPQVKFLETTLNNINRKIDVVLYLDIHEKTIITRLLDRLVCPVCKTTYNRVSMPPKNDTLCDKDQTPLVQRSDDTDEKKIVTRLNEYKQSTQPLVAYFQEQGVLKVIDANQGTATIRQQLTQIIGAINGQH